MDFDQAIGTLNSLLLKEEPRTFNTSWIIARAPTVYRYIHQHVRTESDQIDWDTVTRALGKDFQRRWVGRRHGPKKHYENQTEVDAILKKSEDKMYIYIALQSEEDKLLRDKITVSLVRLAQKGNLLAQQQVVMLVRCTVDDWIEKYFVLSRWSSYGEEIDDKIIGCVQRYRYTGSFFGYLFKTMYYSARYLRYVYSLDRPLYDDSETTLADRVVQDAETGEVRMYDRSYHSDVAH
jgi:hypothetical protein